MPDGFMRFFPSLPVPPTAGVFGEKSKYAKAPGKSRLRPLTSCCKRKGNLQSCRHTFSTGWMLALAHSILQCPASVILFQNNAIPHFRKQLKSSHVPFRYTSRL